MINKLLLAVFMIALTQCKPKEKAIKNANTLKSSSKMMTIKNCPEDGVCTFKVEPYKSIRIAKDEFGNTYPEFPIGKQTLLTFEYKRNPLEGVADSNYRELIILEVDNNPENLSLKDSNLQNVKATFARLCFCRGATGYYPIKEGDLQLTKTADNQYKLSFSFKINEVPQVIESINETFSL